MFIIKKCDAYATVKNDGNEGSKVSIKGSYKEVAAIMISSAMALHRNGLIEDGDLETIKSSVKGMKAKILN